MITSVQNNRVKQWCKLQTRKGRVRTGTFLIEGYHLVEEALASRWEIKEVILMKGNRRPDSLDNIQTTIVSETVFQKISQTKTPQGIIGVLTMKKHITYMGDRVLMIDQVQDPGNLGTMIRTADAAGFSSVILGEGTVDLYNDKVIRATQGSLFHIPILQANLLNKIKELKQSGFTIWASALKHATNYDQMNSSEKIALIVGNEGAGIQDKILLKADHIVKIPIYGKSESLNVSVAAGILMYSVSEHR